MIHLAIGREDHGVSEVARVRVSSPAERDGPAMLRGSGLGTAPGALPVRRLHLPRESVTAAMDAVPNVGSRASRQIDSWRDPAVEFPA